MEDDFSLLLVAGGTYLAIVGVLGAIRLVLELMGADDSRTFSFRTWALVFLVIISISAVAWRQG
jgi:hypothetical protein